MLELKLGRVGMNMEEATIKRWHKAAGDTFKKGEPLYDIETEKVAAEVPAPFDGKLVELGPFEELVAGVFPGVADAAVDLDRITRHLGGRIACVRAGDCDQPGRIQTLVECPGGTFDRKPRTL